MTEFSIEFTDIARGIPNVTSPSGRGSFDLCRARLYQYDGPALRFVASWRIQKPHSANRWTVTRDNHPRPITIAKDVTFNVARSIVHQDALMAQKEFQS